MELHTERLADGIDKLTLAGRMDSTGVQEIDLRFTALTATKKALILVDLSRVSFLASIGIRTLVINAKALRQRGGSMALFSPQPLVAEVLKTAGIEMVIPTFDDLGMALGALKTSAAT
jgi:anti-sigma B factor antagonist